MALTVTSPSAFATGHFSVQASGGILSPSKEPPRPLFDRLRAGLGSTSLATDVGGGFLSRVLYYPYGETRHTEGTLPTDYRFTGQRAEMGLGGLYDYHARFYDPYINWSLDKRDIANHSWFAERSSKSG